MGQTYSVYAKLKFKDNDPAPFCKAVRKIVKERDVFSPYDKRDLRTPFGCFCVVTCKRYAYISDDGTFVSDFDASYGWEGVMQDVFNAVMPLLGNGSRVEIYPDHGWERWTVTKGEVKYTYKD